MTNPRDPAVYERRLLNQAARWRFHRRWADLNVEVLSALTTEQGIDFATSVLYERLRSSREHGPFIDRLEKRRPPSPKELDARSISVVIVPGAFYVEYPQSGADGRLVREEAAR